MSGNGSFNIPRDSDINTIGEKEVTGALAPELPDFNFVLRNIRPKHPRIFLNRDILSTIRKEGLTPGQLRWLTRLRRRVDSYPLPPTLDKKLASSLLNEKVNNNGKDLPRVDMGNWATYVNQTGTGATGDCFETRIEQGTD